VSQASRKNKEHQQNLGYREAVYTTNLNFLVKISFKSEDREGDDKSPWLWLPPTEYLSWGEPQACSTGDAEVRFKACKTSKSTQERA
jgi:hypothetical protein